jgi:hypothetical protein
MPCKVEGEAGPVHTRRAVEWQHVWTPVWLSPVTNTGMAPAARASFRRNVAGWRPAGSSAKVVFKEASNDGAAEASRSSLEHHWRCCGSL